jgi:hypothetical protein
LPHYNSKVRRHCRFFVLISVLSAQASEIDLTNAHLTVPASLTKQESKAIEMLRDEVEKRTLIRFPIGRGAAPPAVAIERAHGPAEG